MTTLTVFITEFVHDLDAAKSFYQEVKMLACKGIFETPSIDTVLVKAQ